MDPFENVIAGLYESLIAKRSLGRARVVLFVSARRNAERAHVAATFARIAAGRMDRGCWLVDLDVADEGQYRRVADAPAFARFGPLVTDDCLNTTHPFWRVEAGEALAPDQVRSLLKLYKLVGAPLSVTRFHGEALPADAKVIMQDAPAFWRAARGRTGVVVADAPSVERSSTADVIARRADVTVMVVEDTPDGHTDARALSQRMTDCGAKRIGAVLVAPSARPSLPPGVVA